MEKCSSCQNRTRETREAYSICHYYGRPCEHIAPFKCQHYTPSISARVGFALYVVTLLGIASVILTLVFGGK